MDLLDKYVIQGNLESIKTVINGNDWKLDSEWNDYDLLKKALTYKQRDITKFFIENNFRVNKFSVSETDTTPLHIAIKLEWKDIVLLLLEKGASVEVQDTASKLSPIQLSFFMRKYELTDLMLPFDKGESINDYVYIKNPEHLHIACARNCVSAVKNYLCLGERINNCSELNSLNCIGYTPLHFAVHFQSHETVELLIKCGANIKIGDKKENTPLHLALNLQDESLIDLLLSEHTYMVSNPKNSYGVSHFHIACTRNNPKVVYGFLQCDVDINAEVEGGPWSGHTALHLAVIHQCVDVIKLLLSQDNLVIDDSDIFSVDVYKTENSEIINLITSRNKSLLTTEFSGQMKLNPFFRACIKGDKGKIESLLLSGVPVNEQLPLDSLLFPGATPLHILIAHNFDFLSGLICLILQNDANVTAKDARGLTHIHLVFQNFDNYITALFMLDHSKFKSNASDNDGLSHFHIACAVNANKIVDWFLDDMGVDVNAAVSENSLQYPGWTPLHMAATHMHTDVLLKLLIHGANIMIKNRQGLAPFDLLIRNWSFTYDITDDDVKKIMLKLIEVYRRDYITFDGLEFNLLHAACIAGDKNLVEHCLKDQVAMDSALNSALNSTCGLFAGFTPLHFAVLQGDEEIIQILLDHGADPAACSVRGDTPLHTSITLLEEEIYCRDFDDRLFLLDDNPFNSSGFSHFHIACAFDKLEMVKVFLDRGIDPDIRTRRPRSRQPFSESWINETGLHAAVRAGHRRVVLLLLERGADANASDVFERTPLHMVFGNDDESIVKLLVESGGSDVNSRDSKGKTPLQSVCRFNAQRPAVNALLEAGADIDLMDNRGDTVFKMATDMYDSGEPDDGVLIPILKHALRLKVAGYPINKQNEFFLALNKGLAIDYIEEFEIRCLEELQRMDSVRLGGRTTLCDVLRIRNANLLATLAGNEVFQRLVDGELPEEGENSALNEFPIYGYLARLQFRRGWKRRQITTVAIQALRKLVEKYCSIRLPDDCAEILLSYLTEYDDLERLVHAAK